MIKFGVNSTLFLTFFFCICKLNENRVLEIFKSEAIGQRVQFNGFRVKNAFVYSKLQLSTEKHSAGAISVVCHWNHRIQQVVLGQELCGVGYTSTSRRLETNNFADSFC